MTSAEETLLVADVKAILAEKGRMPKSDLVKYLRGCLFHPDLNAMVGRYWSLSAEFINYKLTDLVEAGGVNWEKVGRAKYFWV